MRIFNNLNNLPVFKNAVVTQGTFDGVHPGHLKIINRLNKIAEEIDGETVLITFFPHPRMVLHKDDNNLKLINTLEEKIELLEKAGIQNLLVLPFTDEFARLTPLQFVREVLVRDLNAKMVVVGHDHRFGRNREGCFTDLVEMGLTFGFEVEEIPSEDIEHVAVSSTRVRNYLLNGDMEQASVLLGRNYSIDGIVVDGRKLGRQLGYPTANIQVSEPFKLIPKDGVYAGRLKVGEKWYPGMVNIGNNPTVDGKDRTIEINLFDFNENIYTFAVRLELVMRFRDEIKFDDIDQLKKQIQKDETAIKAYFGIV